MEWRYFWQMRNVFPSAVTQAAFFSHSTPSYRHPRSQFPWQTQAAEVASARKYSIQRMLNICTSLGGTLQHKQTAEILSSG